MIRKLLNVILVLACTLNVALAQTTVSKVDAWIAHLETLEEGTPEHKAHTGYTGGRRTMGSLKNGLGENWRDLWVTPNAKNDDDLIDHYIGVAEIPLKLPFVGFNFSIEKRKELINYIASKESVTAGDLRSYTQIKMFDSRVFDRVDEFAALSESTSVKNQSYFILKHRQLGLSRSYVEVMTLAEWFEIASANSPMSVSAYDDMRSGILSSVAQAIINQRTEENIDIKSEEFNTLVSGVRAALASPLFDGLKDAVDALEIGLAIPEGVDFSDQIAVANNSKTIIERKINNTKPEDHLGSIMFVLGETAYDQWRIGVVTPQ